jgi:hypothetical protein
MKFRIENGLSVYEFVTSRTFLTSNNKTIIKITNL